MKIRPVGAELFYEDRRIDRKVGRNDEANRRFPQFCECAHKTAQQETTTSCKKIINLMASPFKVQ